MSRMQKGLLACGVTECLDISQNGEKDNVVDTLRGYYPKMQSHNPKTSTSRSKKSKKSKSFDRKSRKTDSKSAPKRSSLLATACLLDSKESKSVPSHIVKCPESSKKPSSSNKKSRKSAANSFRGLRCHQSENRTKKDEMEPLPNQEQFLPADNRRHTDLQVNHYYYSFFPSNQPSDGKVEDSKDVMAETTLMESQRRSRTKKKSKKKRRKKKEHKEGGVLGAAFSHPAVAQEDDPPQLGIIAAHPNWIEKRKESIFNNVHSEPSEYSDDEVPPPPAVIVETKTDEKNWDSTDSLSFFERKSTDNIEFNNVDTETFDLQLEVVEANASNETSDFHPSQQAPFDEVAIDMEQNPFDEVAFDMQSRPSDEMATDTVENSPEKSYERLMTSISGTVSVPRRYIAHDEPSDFGLSEALRKYAS